MREDADDGPIAAPRLPRETAKSNVSGGLMEPPDVADAGPCVRSWIIV